MGFTKVFPELTTSSVWNLPYPHRIVWSALMANAHLDGIVPVSEDSLWRLANVTQEEASEALKCFLSPDPKSRTKAHEGRRVQLVDGGIFLLNYQKYREKQSPEAKRDYMRRYMAERRRREKEQNPVNFVRRRRGKLTTDKKEAWRDDRKLEAKSASALVAAADLPTVIKDAAMRYAKMREALATEGASLRDCKRWTMDNAHSLIDQTRAQIAAGRPEKAIADRIQSATTGGYHSVKFDRFYA